MAYRQFVLSSQSIFWVPAHFRVEMEIGAGSFGSVCRVRDESVDPAKNPDNKPTHYAIKKIEWTKYLLEQGAVDLKTLREILTLSHVRGHDNIVMLYDIYLGPGETEENFTSVYLVLELMETDVRQYVVTTKIPVDERVVAIFMYQILRALSYLHDCDIIHRDVATKNILMDSSGMIRLTDFGLAREDSNDPMTSYVVTRWYRAPENVSMDNTYSYQTDIFAAGVVMTELFLGKPIFYTEPTQRNPTDQLLMRMKYLGRPADDEYKTMASNAAFEWVKKHRPSLEPTHSLRDKLKMASDPAFRVMQAMLAFHPKDRPSAKEIMAM
eukprot:PhF_6_TR23244/c0_g1_i5/m.32599/K04441/P38; p38 MAP kinase